MYVPSEIFLTMIFIIFLLELAVGAVVINCLIKADNFVLELIPRCDEFREKLLCGVYKTCTGIMTVQNFVCSSIEMLERKRCEIWQALVNATVIYIAIYLLTGKFKNFGRLYNLAVILKNIGYVIFA